MTRYKCDYHDEYGCVLTSVDRNRQGSRACRECEQHPLREHLALSTERFWHQIWVDILPSHGDAYILPLRRQNGKLLNAIPIQTAQHCLYSAMDSLHLLSREEVTLDNIAPVRETLLVNLETLVAYIKQDELCEVYPTPHKVGQVFNSRWVRKSRPRD